MKQKTISIVVPIYNTRQYLSRCIESITGQTYFNLEIILVDDGSTDGSAEICDDYARRDSRIVVIHKNNSGVSDARNEGLKVASGELLAFVDSDDHVETDMYEMLCGIQYAYGADIVECGYYGNNRNETIHGQDTGAIREYDRISGLRELILAQRFRVNVWNKLYRKDLIKKITFPPGRINEDIYWTFKVFSRAEKIIFWDKAKYYHAKRDKSITCSNDYAVNMDKFYAYTERLEFIKKSYGELYDIAQKKLLLFIFGKYLSIYSINDLDLTKDLLKELNNYIFDNYPGLHSNKKIGRYRIFIKLLKNNYKIGVLALLLFNRSKPLIKRILRIVKIPLLKNRHSRSKQNVIEKKVKSLNNKNTPLIYLMLLPEHGNMGDQAIAAAEKEFIEDNISDFNILELSIKDTDQALKIIKKKH
jgi:glycosyltransferase involved in cell wall biosynthesis